MQAISVLSRKGGAGKTTLAVHLAVAAHRAGLRAAVIDLDPQGTARKWGERRDGDPEVAGDHAEQLAAMKGAVAANGADLLIVDTAPNADRASLLAAKAADFILIPCRPAKFDLEAIEATLDLVSVAKKPAAIVINAAKARSPIVSEAIDGLQSRGAIVVPHVIHDRVALSHAVIDGRTAQEFEPAGKATEEVQAVFTWACQQVGLQA